MHEFDVEFELLSRIDHPNIVNVLGGGSVPRPFIVLERLKDLSQLLDLNANDSRPSVFRRRAFSYTELLKLAKNLADALNYLHTQTHEEASIIHRGPTLWIFPSFLCFVLDVCMYVITCTFVLISVVFICLFRFEA